MISSSRKLCLVYNRIIFKLIFVIIYMVVNSQSQIIPTHGPTSSSQLNRCEVCKLLVRSFENGLERTARGKFEGGDSHWEENNLKSYSNSEIRLVEIQEKLCDELPKDKDQCHMLAEESESHLESWWFSKRTQELFTYLCIKELKLCCPDKHYGPECVPCPGYPDAICQNRGYCIGNGTRFGSGLCQCYEQFTGEMCHRCAVGYWKSDSLTFDPSSSNSKLPSEPTSESLVCEKCDFSCRDCRGPGPKNCLTCKVGFSWDNHYGCLDVDECNTNSINDNLNKNNKKSPNQHICGRNSFCVNTEGSYHCYACDKSCDGCNGDGPDLCLKCASGHHLEDGICVDSEMKSQEFKFLLTRYATYLGLCLATVIILRKNIYIASVIGLLVAMYIGLAEFTLKDGGQFSFGKMFSM